MKFESKILRVCLDVYKMLLHKNQAYGNSASDPLRIFSKTDKLEQIRVRMDDKLSRIKNQVAGDNEDAYNDLLGYLVIYQGEKKYDAMPDEPVNVYVVNSDVLCKKDENGKFQPNKCGMEFVKTLWLKDNAEVYVITDLVMGKDTQDLINFLTENNVIYKYLACKKPDDPRPGVVVLPELFVQLKAFLAEQFPKDVFNYAIVDLASNAELFTAWKELDIPVWSLHQDDHAGN